MTPIDPRPAGAPPVAEPDGTNPERLWDLEQVIGRGLGTFVEVGNALLEIRDSRLYREQHATFEAYCRERWGFNRHRASQLIGAAQVVTTVTTDIPITSERQARALAPVIRSLGPDAAREVLAEAANGGKVTASGITEAARRRADELMATESQLNDYVESGEDVQRARRVAAFSRWCAQLSGYYLHDPEEMRRLRPPEEMSYTIAGLRRWLDEYEGRPTAPALRLVEGGPDAG